MPLNVSKHVRSHQVHFVKVDVGRGIVEKPFDVNVTDTSEEMKTVETVYLYHLEFRATFRFVVEFWYSRQVRIECRRGGGGLVRL